MLELRQANADAAALQREQLERSRDAESAMLYGRAAAAAESSTSIRRLVVVSPRPSISTSLVSADVSPCPLSHPCSSDAPDAAKAVLDMWALVESDNTFKIEKESDIRSWASSAERKYIFPPQTRLKNAHDLRYYW